MKCPKCGGELEADTTTIYDDYIDVQLICKEDYNHRFSGFLGTEDIEED